MTEVGVLLPFRDAEATLEAALDSVLSQRQAPGLRVLAVDDRSRDAGAHIARRLAARHRQLQVIPSARPGLVGALNTGLAALSCPLVARMDADDVSLPDRLRMQVDAMARDPDVCVLGTAVAAFPAGSFGGGTERYIGWQNSLRSPAEHRAQLFVESPLCHPSTLLRRGPVVALGGYRDGDFPEDYDLWLRCDRAGLRLAKLPDVLLRWRQGPGRATLTDPRYAPRKFLALKAPFLAARLGTAQAVTVWGAGKTGRRLAAALRPCGVRVNRFIDVDPAKIGRSAQGAPIVDPDDLRLHRPARLLVAVGTAGVRDRIRAHLTALSLAEGRDFLCAA